jgi:hypothetical protein
MRDANGRAAGITVAKTLAIFPRYGIIPAGTVVLLAMNLVALM